MVVVPEPALGLCLHGVCDTPMPHTHSRPKHVGRHHVRGVCVVVPAPALWLPPHLRGESRVVAVGAGVGVLRHSSSWLMFAADLCEVTDVGLQAFSGAVASSPTLMTVTIEGACVGSGREPGSDVPGGALTSDVWRGCPGRLVTASAHARRVVVAAAGVWVLRCCATAHRGGCLPQTSPE